MTKHFLLLLLVYMPFFATAQKQEASATNTIRHVQIPMPDGDSLSAVVAIPKTANGPLPAILRYSIYANSKDDTWAEVAANAGYAGIAVNTRGMNRSKSMVEPFEHDANDAWHMLDWISRQEWCDGKIGMYGGSYLGFSQWAAAKALHPALKTIVPQAAVGAGIDFPAHNGIFSVYSLQWLDNIMDSKIYDQSHFGGKTMFNAVTQWKRQGLPFRAIDSLADGPNKVYRKWLANPAYSAYWQNMTPNAADYSRINIPILSITGYYDVDQMGALHYYRQHMQHNPTAEHYLIIGPYDHFGAQGIQGEKVFNYPIPEAARLNFYKIPFEWFDYVLKGKEKPEVLKDKVNYHVMGTTEWRSATSLSKISDNALKFYLTNQKSGKHYKLGGEAPGTSGSIGMEIDFRKKDDYGRSIRHNEVITRSLRAGGIQYVSEPLNEPLLINGGISGELQVISNKKDMDLMVELYELTASGDYHDLSRFFGRASLTANPSERHLLTPGVIETIRFDKSNVVSKKVEAGSRLVVVLGINKNEGYQINYGTGKDVSDESIKDAYEPLKIQWLNGSFVNIPVARP